MIGVDVHVCMLHMQLSRAQPEEGRHWCLLMVYAPAVARCIVGLLTHHKPRWGESTKSTLQEGQPDTPNMHGGIDSSQHGSTWCALARPNQFNTAGYTVGMWDVLNRPAPTEQELTANAAVL